MTTQQGVEAVVGVPDQVLRIVQPALLGQQAAQAQVHLSLPQPASPARAGGTDEVPGGSVVLGSRGVLAVEVAERACHDRGANDLGVAARQLGLLGGQGRLHVRQGGSGLAHLHVAQCQLHLQAAGVQLALAEAAVHVCQVVRIYDRGGLHTAQRTPALVRAEVVHGAVLVEVWEGVFVHHVADRAEAEAGRVGVAHASQHLRQQHQVLDAVTRQELLGRQPLP